MREKYASFSDNVWKNALDYPGKPAPEPPDTKPKLKSDAEIDAMIERQNERLRQREIGRKILEFESTAIKDRKLLEDRVPEVAEQVEQIAESVDPDDAAQQVQAVAKRERVSVDEVWRAANAVEKAEKYDGKEEWMKFYYPMTMEDALKVLKTGKLVNEDDSGNPLKSSLELTADYEDDSGNHCSGFDLARTQQKQREVTLVFDKALLEEAGFNALGKNPHITSEIDLRKCCVAAVIERNSDRVAFEYARRQNDLAIPMAVRYDRNGADLWKDEMQSADYVRQMREDLRKRMDENKSFQKEIYDEVNAEEVQEAVNPFLNRIEASSAESIMRLPDQFTSEREKREAEREILRYLGGILGMQDLPLVQHYQNKDDPAGASYVHGTNGQPNIIRLNEAHGNTMRLETLVALLSHEMWHARQHNLVDRMNASQLDGDIKRRAALYEVNFANQVPLALDPENYRKQLIEAEAFYFGDYSYQLLAQKYAEAHRPLNRLRRRVRDTVRRS